MHHSQLLPLMSISNEGGSNSSGTPQKIYRGIRRRKWGKWVSEIRVPGTSDRLWLGSYSSPEAAAVANDIAKYCLRQNTSLDDFNFPLVLPAGVQKGMSPRSVQKAATDAGMAIDARFLSQRPLDSDQGRNWQCTDDNHSDFQSWDSKELRTQGEALNISVDDYL